MSLKIGQFLVERGYLRPDQIQVVLREQERRYRLFGQICLDLNFIEERTMLEQLSEFHHLPYVDLEETLLKTEVVGQIPKPLALACQAILIDRQREEYIFAMVDPLDLRLIEPLRNHLGMNSQLTFYLSTTRQILEAINLYYPRSLEMSSLESKAIELIQDVLHDAVHEGTSDIHFRPEEVTLSIWYRIDGILCQYRTLHKEIWDSLLVRLKILSKSDMAETRRAQSGSFELHHGGKKLDCRISFHPTIHGENVVIRLLDQQRTLKTLPDLGFFPEQQDLLAHLSQVPDGLIFISGPTGSGKTTTLYALLQVMDTRTRHVMTLEDPVEYHFIHIRQTEIMPGILDFADGIRSLLRQDPDVIFISEIRDSVTAEMAIRAALTGHVVLATIHARDNLLVLQRLRELGVLPEMLTGLLRGLVNQRLVRCCCPQCRGQGCLACGEKGYKGRIVVAEVLEIDHEFHEKLAQGGNWSELMQWRKGRKTLSLAQTAQRLVAEGKTSLKEVQRIYRE